MSFLSFAQRLAEYELQQRQANRVQRNYKTAGFPAHKHLEGFDYRHQTTISKRQINSLLDFRFIDERNNVIFIGPPGVGKTHLTIGITTRPSRPDTGYCFAPRWSWWKNWSWQK
ncbi:ATP-binding protein [Klebsiella michiganensis]|nr:ATP-binding protein [Klebsiella michiganensis]